ncbi:hypothetical protein ACN9MZ_22025 [Pseudoduganella sp. S-14]|uniref:hypothetical protein n=1 Tax=Pseudoduganella sp. S-14 TaxID=3404065 RepID=UPI003CF88B82
MLRQFFAATPQRGWRAAARRFRHWSTHRHVHGGLVGTITLTGVLTMPVMAVLPHMPPAPR